ncbi:MAG: aminoacyl-tRNA hydrolase [Phycisphaeraceae bacterium]|nr:aminoacyl-tRNA hydrolase [Phycisphaeraceae bacterium]
MKVIVGLGNPGMQYERTRHNAGFMAIDRLAHTCAKGSIARARFNGACLDAEIAGEKCILLKPTTYMNLSGRAVAEAVRFYKLQPASDLLVLVDDVALPVGAIRLRADGSAGGHNGLADIERALGTSVYPRCRIGVGSKPPQMIQSDWVLSRFQPEEQPLLDKAVEQASLAAIHFAERGIESAMNRFNVRISDPAAQPKPAPQTRSGQEPGPSPIISEAPAPNPPIPPSV